MIRDIAQPKRDGIPFKDMSHGNAERRPGKLNEREHGVYMTEAERNFNIGENPELNRRSESAIARWGIVYFRIIGIKLES